MKQGMRINLHVGSRSLCTSQAAACGLQERRSASPHDRNRHAASGAWPKIFLRVNTVCTDSVSPSL